WNLRGRARGLVGLGLCSARLPPSQLRFWFRFVMVPLAPFPTALLVEGASAQGGASVESRMAVSQPASLHSSRRLLSSFLCRCNYLVISPPTQVHLRVL